MGYEGHTLTMWPEAGGLAAVRESMAALAETRDLIEADGIPCPS